MRITPRPRRCASGSCHFATSLASSSGHWSSTRCTGSSSTCRYVRFPTLQPLASPSLPLLISETRRCSIESPKRWKTAETIDSFLPFSFLFVVAVRAFSTLVRRPPTTGGTPCIFCSTAATTSSQWMTCGWSCRPQPPCPSWRSSTEQSTWASLLSFSLPLIFGE